MIFYFDELVIDFGDGFKEILSGGWDISDTPFLEDLLRRAVEQQGPDGEFPYRWGTVHYRGGVIER